MLVRYMSIVVRKYEMLEQFWQQHHVSLVIKQGIYLGCIMLHSHYYATIYLKYASQTYVHVVRWTRESYP